MLRRPLRSCLILATTTGVWAPWPTWAAELPAQADLWRDLGTTDRVLSLGEYDFPIQERVVENKSLAQWIPAVMPSPQAEVVAWLYRSLNGATVRYDEFLGSERVRFQRSLSFRLGTEQVVPTEVEGVITQVYDRNHDGRVSRREMVRGNRDMAGFFCARVRAELEAGPGFQTLAPLPTATAFADAWLSYESDKAWHDLWYCPDCIGVPHLDKQAALVRWLQEYSPPIEGAHTALLVPGLNQLFVTLDEHPDRGATLRLEASDGRVYWDTGSLPHGDAALDGSVDLVTSLEAFTGASYNTVTKRWERYDPSAANQWLFEVWVDLAHAHLPRRWQVAEAMALEPNFEVPDWFEDDLDARFAQTDETTSFLLDTDDPLFQTAPPPEDPTAFN